MDMTPSLTKLPDFPISGSKLREYNFPILIPMKKIKNKKSQVEDLLF